MQEERIPGDEPSETEPNNITAYTAKNTVAAGAGAIIMLISLTLPWYALNVFGNSLDIKISHLMTMTGERGFVLVGSALPVIAIIIFASIVLLFAIYSLLEGVENTKFLCWLGALSAASIIVNAVYILYWVYDNSNEWVYIINSGVILAFIGSLVIILSHPAFRKVITEPGLIARAIEGKLDDWFTNHFEDPAKAVKAKEKWQPVKRRIQKWLHLKQ